jgi:glycosyltransferase involved in cell wall biosynthesis
MERFEVVVVSDGSTDRTDAVLAEPTPFHLVAHRQANQGPAVARNAGVSLASGSLVVFVDDDVVASPRLVEEHVASHRASPAASRSTAVIGPMATPAGVRLSPWVAWEQRMLYKQYDALAEGRYACSPRQFYTGNASIPKHVFVEAGGFDPRFRRAEDIELAYRLEAAGVEFAFNPDAIGYHHAERSFDSWLAIARDYGANDVDFARRGHTAVAGTIRDGFSQRPALLRLVLQQAVRHPRTAPALQHAWRGAFRAAHGVHWHRVAQLCLSGLYSTAYYGGVAAELGGSDAFRDTVVRSSRPFPAASGGEGPCGAGGREGRAA